MPGKGFVLIVEDDPGNRALTEQQLRLLGYEAVAVPGGAEALEVVRADLPAIILLDSNMPGMSGRETCLAIRKLSGAERVPIVAVTADTTDRARDGFLAAGAEEVLHRPVLVEALRATLERWVGGSTSTASGGSPEPTPARMGVLSHLRSDVGEETTLRIVSLYLQKLDERLADIGAALAASDAGELAFTAHALKSATSVFDHSPVMGLCSGLEELGDSGQITGGDALLQELRQAADALGSQLSREIGTDQDDPGSAIR